MYGYSYQELANRMMSSMEGKQSCYLDGTLLIVVVTYSGRQKELQDLYSTYITSFHMYIVHNSPSLCP